MKLLAIATLFLAFLLFSALTTSLAQTNCTTSGVEFEALTKVLQALGQSNSATTKNLCTKLRMIPSSKALNGIMCDGQCHITAVAYTNQGLKGQISPYIGNLTYLQVLNFEKNVLSGHIPSEIGKLHNLENMTIRWNALTGHLPPEIGNLTNLTRLHIESNDFTGSIPKELGNLQNLVELDFASCNLGGEIPLELANLTSLRIWNGYDNNFNGPMPDIFTNTILLQELRLYGNNLEGPFPLSLGNLKNLEILYMGEFSINNNIPSTLRNLRALKKLSLRNCNLTGEIPNYLWNFENMTYLDLSFNELSGNISIASGSLIQLETLLLQSNMLSGELPLQLGNLRNLRQLDVSYNELSGSLPTWLKKQDLEKNLIWNFFNMTYPNERPIEAEFNCLDNKGRPNCTRSRTGNNDKFYINCGGDNINLSNVAYNDDLGDGNITFTKHASGKWATSTSSYGTGFQARRETQPQSSGISNAEDPELYRTARVSPGSLRYYGLNMTNGSYNVTLHFAEIYIITDDGLAGKSTGKRIFDIYIQDKNVFPNFNIMAKAGSTNSAVSYSFKANVTNGVLQIHLKWVGKGTCCIPTEDNYGPLISAIDVSQIGHTSTNSKSHSKGKAKFSIVPLVILLVMASISLWLWHRKKQSSNPFDVDEEFRSIKNKLTLYTYKELRDSTNDFHPLNKLGRGGFGAVYKVILFIITTFRIVGELLALMLCAMLHIGNPKR